MLDQMTAEEVVQLMTEEEGVVLTAISAAKRELAIAAERVAKSFRAGGRTFYVGAGTSGRVAATDAAEMPPTFGVDANRFIAIIPGGLEALARATEAAEDDEAAAIDALADYEVGKNDSVIGLAASGTTPFVVAAIRFAKTEGAWTCGIACNPGTALLNETDLGILLDTGPEVLTGSTRLKAGTAQKLALNRISTTAMVLSGKVIQNLMVDVKANNQKLRQRCVKIVSELAGVDGHAARKALDSSGYKVRDALESLR